MHVYLFWYMINMQESMNVLGPQGHIWGGGYRIHPSAQVGLTSIALLLQPHPNTPFHAVSVWCHPTILWCLERGRYILRLPGQLSQTCFVTELSVTLNRVCCVRCKFDLRGVWVATNIILTPTLNQLSTITVPLRQIIYVQVLKVVYSKSTLWINFRKIFDIFLSVSLSAC